jgi:UDP-2,3-diacylglucosamine pyrophosphatase LpxH
MFDEIYDTVIISDVHLGSPLSKADHLVNTLKALKFKRLILLGDMFADLNFTRLKKDHWEVLSYLRKLSNPSNNIDIIWIVGNHDPELSLLMSHLVGIDAINKFEWRSNTDKRYIAMHGHQFDPAMSFIPKLSKLISWWYLQLQKIPVLKNGFSRWVDSISSQFQNLSAIVEKNATRYAQFYGFDVIICGHTHNAKSTDVNGIKYCNSGCWVKSVCSLITIKDDTVNIVEIPLEK